jgi:enamine deaminase RidA (YjgF/YER057c/UK114 family)
MPDQTSPIQYINPDTVFKSPAFSQAVVTSASAKRIIVGMQNSVDDKGEIVGKGDLAAQSAQTLANIDACLQAAGTNKENITIMRVYLLDGQELQAGFAAFQQWASKTTPPPANTVFWVPRLHNPDLLVGIEVEAIIPS